MKALFRNHFPFVEGTPEEELTPEQLIVKQTYEKLYPKEKDDRLRDVPTDEQISSRGTGNKSVKRGRTK